MEEFIPKGNVEMSTKYQSIKQDCEQPESPEVGKNELLRPETPKLYGISRLHLIFIGLSYLVLILCGSFAYAVFKQNEHVANVKFENLATELLLLKSSFGTVTNELDSNKALLNSTKIEVSSIKVAYSNWETSTSSQLSEVEKKLDSVFNHSNQEVLEELKTTKAEMTSEILASKQDISVALLNVLKNMSSVVMWTKSALADTETAVQHNMDTTIQKMNNVVRNATASIKFVQENVTAQLSLMSSKLTSSVENLDSAVQSAEAAIKSDVADVKSNIEKYTIATNNKFAAENDFVRFQLAGELFG